MNTSISRPRYREELLDIYAEKPNFGHVKKLTHSATLKNPSCSDKITIELEIESGYIKDARFNGTGCVMNTIAASLITENVKEKSVKEVLAFTKDDVNNFIGMTIIPTRLGCALLPLDAIKTALRKNDA